MRGAPRSEIGVGKNGDIDATDLDRAAARLVDAGDEIEERGLARARRPHQREVIADPDVEIDVDQHADDLVAARVVLGQVANLDEQSRVRLDFRTQRCSPAHPVGKSSLT